MDIVIDFVKAAGFKALFTGKLVFTDEDMFIV